MSRFPRFFTHKALLIARNDGSIRAPIITEEEGSCVVGAFAEPKIPRYARDDRDWF